MSTREALLRAVFADPEDDATALVYADWLEENGGPDEQARAAFIRVQRKIAGMEYGAPGRRALAKEEASLLKKHQARWLAGVPKDLRKRVVFEGGFVRRMTLTGADLLAHGDAIFAGHPITELQLTGQLKPEGAESLAGKAWWRGVRLLRLLGSAKSAEALAALLGSPHLRSVREFGADCCQIEGAGMAHVAAWPGLRSVEELRLYTNGLSARAMEVLCASPHLGALTGLVPTNNLLDDRAARVLARCGRLSSLRMLWLYDNRVGPKGVKSLASSPHLAGLERLNLMKNPIENEGVLALIDAFPALRELMLSGSRLRAETKKRVKERFPFVQF